MQLSHQLIEDLINDLDDHKMVTQNCLTFPSVNNKVFNNIIKLLTWNGWIEPKSGRASVYLTGKFVP
jgi:hypothetical protein